MVIVAHRGASAVAPENTMSAFLRAIEAGADAIEFDVQASSDGQLVVIHDSTIDRTTDGTGAVFETDGATIAGLDAGSWFSPDHAGERVPTLADVLDLDDLGFELELYGADFLDGVIATVALPTRWTADASTVSASRSTPTMPPLPRTYAGRSRQTPTGCPRTTSTSP